MKNYFLKTKKLVLAHKIISVIVIAVILGVGYYGYGKVTATTGETLYTTTLVKKGTVVSTITGSGQVSATNQVDVKAKVSGIVTWVNVKVGQKVYAGQALASIDSKTAKASVADAEASLAQAKLQFQKDQATAPIDYQNTVDNLTSAKNDLVTEYNDTFNTISNTYLDLPTVVTGMDNILHGYDLSTSKTQWNVDAMKNLFTNDALVKVQIFADSAESDYKPARAKYDTAILAYKQISRTADPATLETVLANSIDTTTAIAQAIQSEINFLGTVVDVANQYNIKIPATISTMQTSARSYLTTVNSDLNALLAQKKTLDATKQTIKTDEQNIKLVQIGNGDGSNPISLQISQNNLTKQERNLQDLKDNLNDYTVVSPFAGTIASVTAQVGESAATIATVITNQQIAELSLNEVDAAKVVTRQKVTLTFDAISDLSLTGTVAEINPLGTVSQGVVSYTAKITFDTQDPRIKPGMTVNASIQTVVHQDVLYVPSSAVKTSNGQSYVLAFDPPLADVTTTAGVASKILPLQISVQTGISDDTNIEIISGLTEGQQVVSRTTTSTAAKTATSPSATSLLGGNRGGGGAVRIGG